MSTVATGVMTAARGLGYPLLPHGHQHESAWESPVHGHRPGSWVQVRWNPIICVPGRRVPRVFHPRARVAARGRMESGSLLVMSRHFAGQAVKKAVMQGLSEAVSAVFGENRKFDHVEVSSHPLGGDPLRERVTQQIGPILAALTDVAPAVPDHYVVVFAGRAPVGAPLAWRAFRTAASTTCRSPGSHRRTRGGGTPTPWLRRPEPRGSANQSRERHRLGMPRP